MRLIGIVRHMRLRCWRSVMITRRELRQAALDKKASYKDKGAKTPEPPMSHGRSVRSV
jgi:hypothetical protein